MRRYGARARLDGARTLAAYSNRAQDLDRHSQVLGATTPPALPAPAAAGCNSSAFPQRQSSWYATSHDLQRAIPSGFPMRRQTGGLILLLVSIMTAACRWQQGFHERAPSVIWGADPVAPFGTGRFAGMAAGPAGPAGRRLRLPAVRATGACRLRDPGAPFGLPDSTRASLLARTVAPVQWQLSCGAISLYSIQSGLGRSG